MPADGSLLEDRMEAASPPFHLGYRRWLDGLRGVAVLAVLAFHLGMLPGGSLGVDVFFVLSGFLITTFLAEEWQRRGSIASRPSTCAAAYGSCPPSSPCSSSSPFP